MYDPCVFTIDTLALLTHRVGSLYYKDRAVYAESCKCNIASLKSILHTCTHDTLLHVTTTVHHHNPSLMMMKASLFQDAVAKIAMGFVLILKLLLYNN